MEIVLYKKILFIISDNIQHFILHTIVLYKLYKVMLLLINNLNIQRSRYISIINIYNKNLL